MPRKKTVQPKPLERFHLEDGTEIDIIDNTCWPIGRGQHAARGFETQRMQPIIENIISIYMGPNGPQEAKEILSSTGKFTHHLAHMDIFGEDGHDDTNARKLWYKKIKFRAYTFINAKEGALS
jgi:hypothetical protein